MLGEMITYNFDEAFKNAQQQTVSALHNEEKTIAKGSWLESEEYASFLRYKTLKKEIANATKNKIAISENQLLEFENSNPMLFHTHEILGDYFASQKENVKAKSYFAKALSLNIPTTFEKNRIEQKWSKM